MDCGPPIAHEERQRGLGGQLLPLAATWLSVAAYRRRDAIAKARQAQSGPARYLAVQLGTDAETVIRWLVTFLVLLIDPSAVVLTIAAARGRRPAG